MSFGWAICEKNLLTITSKVVSTTFPGISNGSAPDIHESGPDTSYLTEKPSRWHSRFELKFMSWPSWAIKRGRLKTTDCHRMKDINFMIFTHLYSIYTKKKSFLLTKYEKGAPIVCVFRIFWLLIPIEQHSKPWYDIPIGSWRAPKTMTYVIIIIRVVNLFIPYKKNT